MATLRTLIDDCARLTAWCMRHRPTVCGHSGDLDLAILAQRFGWDFDVVDRHIELQRRLRCSICGAYYPSITRTSEPYKPKTGPRPMHAIDDAMPIEEATRRTLELWRMARERDGDRWGNAGGGRVRKFGR